MTSTLDLFRLDGKTAFISGASRGLGRVMALALADAGANVAISGRTGASLASTVAEIEARGVKAWGIEGDMNYAKIGTKLVILIIIGALLGIGAGRQRKSGSVPPAIFWGIGILTLVNAGIAVLWR